jgi:hypothetical protein
MQSQAGLSVLCPNSHHPRTPYFTDHRSPFTAWFEEKATHAWMRAGVLAIYGGLVLAPLVRGTKNSGLALKTTVLRRDRRWLSGSWIWSGETLGGGYE